MVTETLAKNLGRCKARAENLDAACSARKKLMKKQVVCNDSEKTQVVTAAAVRQMRKKEYRRVPKDERRTVAAAVALDIIAEASDVELSDAEVADICQSIDVAWEVYNIASRGGFLKRCLGC